MSYAEAQALWTQGKNWSGNVWIKGDCQQRDLPVQMQALAFIALWAEVARGSLWHPGGGDRSGPHRAVRSAVNRPPQAADACA